MKPIYCVWLSALLLITGCSPQGKPLTQSVKSPWAAVAKGYVTIEGGIISIDSSKPGIIKKILVEEGDNVKKGQLLATITDTTAELTLQEQQYAFTQAQLAVDTAKTQLRIARREFDRVSKLSTSTLSQQKKQKLGDVVSLAIESLKSKQAALKIAQAQIAIAKFDLGQYQIRAPKNGMIVRRYASPGEGASTLDVTRLFSLVPDQPRIIRAEIQPFFINQVHPGQLALVSLEDGNSSHIYHAKVIRISDVFGPAQLNDGPTDPKDMRVVECVLSLLDGSHLRIGQRVIVKIKPLPHSNKRQVIKHVN
ncbi:MAG: p-hydroxybenzoic acid efflux pump subunit AaeA [Candidatus Celerinatantimonas neptuna]|nr:MAG: p-hydroxybenzoic acid efflux pump subunit AaeA [Candidatus Celerinatantimonas neptuna]